MPESTRPRWPARVLPVFLVVALALVGCDAPWRAGNAVAPKATPQFAGGEPVLPGLQVLYREAPLPTSAPPAANSWPVAGYDAANTAAAAAAPLAGRIAWFLHTPGPALAAPVVAEGTVLVNGGDGALYAADARTGAQRWRVPLGDALTAGTPAVAEGVVYVATQGHGLSALRLESGAPIWTVDTQGPVRAPPLAVGSLLFVATGANTLRCLDQRTGAEYWAFKSEDTQANFWPTQGQPAVTTMHGGLVFVALGASTEFNALRLSTGQKVWESAVDSRMVGAPVYDAAHGLVFVATGAGHLYALDANTGAQRWLSSLPGAGGVGVGFAAGPALAGGSLFIGDDGGDVLALDAQTGTTRWTAPGNDALLGPPAVRTAGGVAADIYLAEQRGALVALRADSGMREWRSQLGQLRAQPILAGGVLLVSAVEAHGLYALT